MVSLLETSSGEVYRQRRFVLCRPPHPMGPVISAGGRDCVHVRLNAEICHSDGVTRYVYDDGFMRGVA
jgi:hypothetical protein